MSIASLSLDLDNLWSYQKTHGDPSWQTFPSYLDVVVPLALELFSDLDVGATVFIVGQDAELSQNADALAALGASGVEIANHSFHHEPWLHLKTRQEITDELTRAHEAIGAATARTPIGFRGPGFSLSDDSLNALVALGYRYDGTTLPTFIGPLARAFYFRASELSEAEREKRSLLFGAASEGLRPIKPYRFGVGAGEIIEIPVTTMPLTRVPFHLSYVIYLAGVSARLAKLYWGASVKMCQAFGVEPSVLLHPLDFLGPDDAPGLEFFPGMNLSGEFKRSIVRHCLGSLSKTHAIVPMKEHAERVGQEQTVVRGYRSGLAITRARTPSATPES